MASSTLIEKILTNLNLEDIKESRQAYVLSVSGPVVVGRNMEGCAMYELVLVGTLGLLGEVIRIDGDQATIQVYEETAGLAVDDVILRTHKPLCAELGPGLLGSIYDGIQRPLREVPVFMPRGINTPALDRTQVHYFVRSEEPQWVAGGDILGTVQETPLIIHRVLVPPGVSGRVAYLAETGEYTVEDVICEVETNHGVESLRLYHTWPVRNPRPVRERIPPTDQLSTGLRVLDALFPCFQGGTTAIPGGFGCGKTVISQAVSRYSNSDVIIYVGCGERGNEMSEVLGDYREDDAGISDQDGNSKKPDKNVMNRTVLVANTSNMPVAAREASIYTGITLAEYFRDQGLNVSMLADSTSRWAEALREISGRLAEMPADCGYPAYLGARLALFYERAGHVDCLGLPSRKGSVSIVGAVSPPGGDFSDPVTTATLGTVQVFWGLDKRLAQRKHFPAIDVNVSYSKYCDTEIYNKLHNSNGNSKINQTDVAIVKDLLQKELQILEVVQLVGHSALSHLDRMTLDIARVIREDFLQQNAFSTYDTFCPLRKTALMLRNIVHFYEGALLALLKGGSWETLKKDASHLYYGLIQMKFLEVNEGMEETLKKLGDEIKAYFNK